MKKKFKQPMTAAEALELLRSDRDWVRRNAEREAQSRALETQLKAEELPIINDLASVGIHVSSVWELVNTSRSYPAAIPILVKHLCLPYHPKIREGIVRALTVKEARGMAGREILKVLKSEAEKPSEFRWALVNALTVLAEESMVDEIRVLSVDPRYSDVSRLLRLALKSLRTRQT